MEAVPGDRSSRMLGRVEESCNHVWGCCAEVRDAVFAATGTEELEEIDAETPLMEAPPEVAAALAPGRHYGFFEGWRTQEYDRASAFTAHDFYATPLVKASPSLDGERSGSWP